MTEGISPKVARPLLALVAVGAVLLALGLILDKDAIWTVGLSAIGSALAGAGVGYGAPPGEVTTAIPEASDEMLSPLTAAELDNPPEIEPDTELGESVDRGQQQPRPHS